MSRHKNGSAYSDPVNNPLINMSGTHPHVYPATGSHAIHEKCNMSRGGPRCPMSYTFERVRATASYASA